MGRIWYLHCPYRQVSAILTILSMIVRIQDNEGACASDNIPRKWLMEWGNRDLENAIAVDRILKTYELEKQNPLLAKQLQEMQDKNCEKKNFFAEGSVTLQAGSTLLGDVNINKQENES